MKIFENKISKLVYGSTEEVLNTQVADASVDLIFVDPPYNIGKKFANFYDQMA